MTLKSKNQPRNTLISQEPETISEQCPNNTKLSTEMAGSLKRKLFNKKRYMLMSAMILISLFIWILYANKQLPPIYLSSHAEKLSLALKKYISHFKRFQEYKRNLFNFIWRFSHLTWGNLCTFIGNINLKSKKLVFFLSGQLNLMLIWTKYILNISFSTAKFEYKKLSRKYQIIMFMQTTIYRVFQVAIGKILDFFQYIQFFFAHSSNYTFYFTTISIIVINVIVWENIIMKNTFEDYRLNNLKIVTSTISSLLTVYYLTNIERFAQQVVGKYYNYIYGFCSRAFLHSDSQPNDEFDDHSMKDFTFISNDWWRARKFESLFKGVEIINEIKKRSEPQITNTISKKLNPFKNGILNRFRLSGEFSKDICNVLINGNQEIRIFLRVVLFFISTSIVTLILYLENKRVNTNKNIRSHSKIYSFFTVVSGLSIPILLNNIQKFSTYKEQGQIIFILLFLSLKLITNHKHFLILILELIHNIKSKFSKDNNFEKIFLHCQEKESYIENTQTNNNEKPQISEISSLTKDRTRKTSLLIKTTKSCSNSLSNDVKTKSDKKCSNQRKQSLSKDLNKNRMKQLNDLIRTKITSKHGLQEMFNHSIDPHSDEKIKSNSSIISLSEIIGVFKKLLNTLKDMTFGMFIEKVLGSVLYIFIKDHRGLIISSFDHYKLSKYIKESKVPMNVKEELLRSMTLCYTNIGNPQIIRSINLPKKELIHDLEKFKMVIPNTPAMEKLKNSKELSSLSQLEIILKPFSGIKSLEEKINTEIQYYLILNSINVLSVSCETIKESCKAVINSESLIELINNITNHDLEKINLLLNSNIDYGKISSIIKSVILMNENKTSIWNRFSLITSSISKVHMELVGKLIKLKDIDIDEIFVQWNILRSGLKYVLNQIKNNRKSYEDIYMGGLPLHTLQMALHYLNSTAKKTSDLVQESIVACSEFCLYFNLKTIDELYELNKSSAGQSKLFELCKKDCNDILNLIQTIQSVLEELCENKIRIDGKEIDISYLSSMLPAVVLNSEHKCCIKETESNCKLHGKGLQDTFRLYAEGNFPAITNSSQLVQSKRESSKFIPERPRSSIPRESSNNRDTSTIHTNEEKPHTDHSSNNSSNNESLSNQTGLRRPKEITKKEEVNNLENLPFLPSTPEELIQ